MQAALPATTGSFTVIPALDLRAGQVVRLQQGDYTRQTRYPAAPAALAAHYAAAGADWLHVVDLDGARAGRLDNLPVIEQLARSGLRIQAGGGVRAAADLQRLFDVGVTRAVVGSVAIRDPDTVMGWLDVHGAERIVLALDARRIDGRWALPSAGWTELEAAALDELVQRYAAYGAKHLLCTDIDRDGMLAGFNLALYRELKQQVPALKLQASGGVRSLADIRAAREAGAAAVILGRALLEGRFPLTEALRC